MDKQLTNLKRRMVKLDDFFRDMASTFRKKAGLTSIYFLLSDNITQDFITVFPARSAHMKIRKNDLAVFYLAMRKEVFFPKRMSREWSIWKRIRNVNIIWKIYKYNISAIMPIKGSNGVCCLIVFCDRHADNWFSKNNEFVYTINQHISFCMEAILLYNRTLEGIIKKYDPSQQIPAKKPIKTDNESFQSFVERKKVEFL